MAALEDAFKAHGVQTNRTDQVVSILGTDLSFSAAVVQSFEHPNQRVVQLDVRAKSQRLAPHLLIESFAGLGPDESSAAKDAFNKFLRCSMHVLLAVIVDVKYGTDQVEWTSWRLGDTTWRVCLGPLFI
jgi:hypothetical protein